MRRDQWWWAVTLLTTSDSRSLDAERLTSPRLRMPTIRLLLLITGNRRSFSSDGWPWTHPANTFAEQYVYAKGSLPVCDDLAERSALLSIASCLSDQDVNEIVAAFQKVARSGLLN